MNFDDIIPYTVPLGGSQQCNRSAEFRTALEIKCFPVFPPCEGGIKGGFWAFTLAGLLPHPPHPPLRKGGRSSKTPSMKTSAFR